MYTRLHRIIKSSLTNPILRKKLLHAGSATTLMSSTVLMSYQLSRSNLFNDKTLHSELSTEIPTPKWSARKPNFDLEHVGGNTEILNSLSDIVEYLIDPKKFTDSGLQAPRGVILSGPPGVGKTMIAEAIAGHSGVPIIMISGPEIEASLVGVAENNLRQLFEVAKQNAPCVLCIDEIDSMAPKRFATAKTSTELYVNSKVDQLLSLLSQQHPGLIVIGTTNNYESLDPAIVRPGRFDKHIYVPLPDYESRLKIIEKYTQNKTLAANVSIKELASLSLGFSGAKIESWINQAAILASKNNDKEIKLSYLDRAKTILEHGTQHQVQTNVAKKMNTAKHEAGHAIVGYHLGFNLYKISTLQSNDGYGYNDFMINEQESTHTRTDALNRICMLLAGRAAENLFMEPQFGNHSDFNKAKKIASTMVNAEGMGSTISGINASDEVELILQAQMERAKTILLQHKKQYDHVVTALMEHNELYRDEFLSVIAGKVLNKNQPNKGLFSDLFNPAAPKPTKSALPAKKPYREYIYAAGKSPADPDKKKIPLSLEEIAKAIGVNVSDIRNVKPHLFSGFEVNFKPSFNAHDHMQNISKTLKSNNVENIYLHSYTMGEAQLHIYDEGLNDFVKYVQEKNASGNRPRR